MNVAAATNVFTPDRPVSFTFPPPADPFGSPVAVNSHPQHSFANFDDNPIFSSVSAPSLPVSASFPTGFHPLRAPAEDKYAALKDLDSQMKQQHEPSTSPSGTSDWTNNHVESVKSANPFAQTINTNQSTQNGFSSNPFRSGFEVGTNAPAWGGIPSSQSMPFPVSWNTPNDLTVGASRSRNPFL